MLSNKELKAARNEAIKDLNICCNKCGNHMRKMGEWPKQINEKTEDIVLVAQWMCMECTYPSKSKGGDTYQAKYSVFISLE